MRQHLSNLIKNIGPISVADFMNEALFNPLHGYYNQQNPFGKNGDFITAPEISQTFGELIGAYFISLWQNNYAAQKINLVEMGAGRGTLMSDLLNLAYKIPGFKENVAIHIIEISPRLQNIQKENLANYQINWWNNFADFSEKNSQQPIFFIANELFDCLAMNQFEKTEKGWRERVVTIGPDGKLCFALADYNEITNQKINKLCFESLSYLLPPSSHFSSPSSQRKLGSQDSHEIPAFAGMTEEGGSGMTEEGNEMTEGSVFEYSQAAANLMEEISNAIKKTNGVGIIIDYGYIKNEFKNTLQALKNHQYCDVLKNAGDADITALVNFSQLQNIAQNQQLKTSLVTQKEFLEALGIKMRREKLIAGKSAKEQEEITSAINRLTDSKQMGELFKCLIFWS